MAKGSTKGRPGPAGESGADGQATKAAPRRPAFTLKPSKQTCIALGALMGLTLLGSIGLFVWRSQEIAKIQAEVEQKQKEVASGEQIARRLTQVEADYAGMQNQLRFLETSVTEGQYVPTLLKQMEGLAKSVKLQVNGVRPTFEPAPGPPSDKEARKNYVPWPYDKLHVEMDVKGSYWNIAQMLYRLTEFQKIIAVESVSITPNNSQTGYNPDLNVKMSLTGFIFKGDKPATEGQGSGGNGPGSEGKASSAAVQMDVPANGTGGV
jgi:Tfp pilus assembly protein PilO